MKKNFRALLFFIIGWWFSTTIIQMMKCPKMTQTEILLNTPKSIILYFKECN